VHTAGERPRHLTGAHPFQFAFDAKKARSLEQLIVRWLLEVLDDGEESRVLLGRAALKAAGENLADAVGAGEQRNQTRFQG
jgi:hypothetical protein